MIKRDAFPAGVVVGRARSAGIHPASTTTHPDVEPLPAVFQCEWRRQSPMLTQRSWGVPLIFPGSRAVVLLAATITLVAFSTVALAAGFVWHARQPVTLSLVTIPLAVATLMFYTRTVRTAGSDDAWAPEAGPPVPAGVPRARTELAASRWLKAMTCCGSPRSSLCSNTSTGTTCGWCRTTSGRAAPDAASLPESKPCWSSATSRANRLSLPPPHSTRSRYLSPLLLSLRPNRLRHRSVVPSRLRRPHALAPTDGRCGPGEYKPPTCSLSVLAWRRSPTGWVSPAVPCRTGTGFGNTAAPPRSHPTLPPIDGGAARANPRDARSRTAGQWVSDRHVDAGSGDRGNRAPHGGALRAEPSPEDLARPDGLGGAPTSAVRGNVQGARRRF